MIGLSLSLSLAAFSSSPGRSGRGHEYAINMALDAPATPTTKILLPPTKPSSCTDEAQAEAEKGGGGGDISKVKVTNFERGCLGENVTFDGE